MVNNSELFLQVCKFCENSRWQSKFPRERFLRSKSPFLGRNGGKSCGNLAIEGKNEDSWSCFGDLPKYRNRLSNVLHEFLFAFASNTSICASRR